MKKVFSLILLMAVILSHSACGGESITMQDVYDAHQLEAMLASHESAHILTTEDGQFYSEYYMNADMVYENGGSWAMYMTDNSCYMYRDDVYSRVVYIDGDGMLDLASFRGEKYASTVLLPMSLKEKIKSVEKSDEHITVTSAMGKKTMKNMNDAMVSNELVYVLDAKTLSPIESDSYYTFEDGTLVTVDVAFEYDGQMPEGVKPFLELERQTADMRTVTMVFNSGTEKESTAVVQAPKGMIIGIAAKSGLPGEYEVYSDPELTELYTPGDYTSDATIYIKWLG